MRRLEAALTIIQVNYLLVAQSAGSLTQTAENLGIAQRMLSPAGLRNIWGIAVFASQGRADADRGGASLLVARVATRSPFA